MRTFQQLLDLALAARPIAVGDDDDAGSERQTAALAAFLEAVKEVIQPGDFHILKMMMDAGTATLDEALNESLVLARQEIAARSYPNVKA